MPALQVHEPPPPGPWRPPRALLDVNVWTALLDDALVDFSRVQGHQQVTDLYLLALAVRHGGRLVTFDRAVALSSVRGATAEHLLVL